MRTFKEQLALCGVEVELAQAVGKELAVDVGKIFELGVHAAGAALGRGVEHAEDAVERSSQVFAVGTGVFVQVVGKLVFGKDQCVVCKKAKQQADDELLEVVLRVVAVFAKGCVQVAYGSGGFNIGLFFSRFEGVADAVHEVEVAQLDLLGQLLQREGDAGLRVQVVQFDVGKVADDDVARHVLRVVVAYFFHVLQRLMVGRIQVFTGGFVFAQQAASPKHVSKFGAAFAMAHGIFGGGGFVAVELEDSEELVPEGVFFGALAGFAFEALGKGLRQAVFGS